MKNLIKSIFIFYILFYSVNSFAATGAATEYKVTMTKLELCETGSTTANCLNPLTISPSGTSGVVDIASVSAGATAGSYGNIAKAKIGTLYTYIQITMSRQFSITGTATVGNTLLITEDTPDPDGTGTLSYSWQSSSDNSNWSEISTSPTYTLTSAEEGKSIKAIVSYTDGEGHAESVTTAVVSIASPNPDADGNGLTDTAKYYQLSTSQGPIDIRWRNGNYFSLTENLSLIHI